MLSDVCVALEGAEDGCGAVEHGRHGVLEGLCAFGAWDTVWTRRVGVMCVLAQKGRRRRRDERLDVSFENGRRRGVSVKR